MFHDISKRLEDCYDEQFSITLSAFENLITQNIVQGKHFKRIGDIKENENGADDIYITFDDAFKGVYSDAFHILKKYNIPFCIFLVEEFIDKPGYLSARMIEEMKFSSLCEIGAHTIHHCKLRNCKASESNEEIMLCKENLERRFNCKINYFAFPYGTFNACSKRDLRYVKEAGFDMGFSTLQVHLTKKSIEKRFFIPRLNINQDNYSNYIN